MSEIDTERLVRGVIGEVLSRWMAEQSNTKPDVAPGVERPKPSNAGQRICLAADDAAGEAKIILGAFLDKMGWQVVDAGAAGGCACALDVARKVAAGDCARGIVLDADGLGAAMLCNKIEGVRAAACHDPRTAVTSRERHNANVLTLGAAFHPPEEICELTQLWLDTPFAGEPRQAVVSKIPAVNQVQAAPEPKAAAY